MSPFVDLLWVCVFRDFMQRLYVFFHGTRGSYLRYALLKSGAPAVARLHAPWAAVPLSFYIIFTGSLLLVDSTAFFVTRH
jgi:hypothetical protein